MKPVWATLALGILTAATPAGQISTPLAIASGVAIPLGPAPRALSIATLPVPVASATPADITGGIATFVVYSRRAQHYLRVRLSDGALLSDTVPHAPTVQNIPASTAVDHTFYPTSTYDGVTYGRQGYGFSAYDSRTGQRYWRTLGANGGPNATPTVVGNVLLQSFADDGAILESVLYGLDVRTGHVLWTNLSNRAPLGTEYGTIALDATWFPAQRDSYLPLTVDTIEIATGKKLTSYTYLPDPARNADGYLQAQNPDRPFAFVADGYVYLDVKDQWYRYRGNAPPATPVALGDAQVRATFANRALLIESPRGLALGTSFPDRLALRPVANAALHAPVATRADGRQYAYAGSSLIAFDGTGRPQRVGTATCSSSDDAAIVFWTKHVAVVCGGDMDRRVYVFADPALAAPLKHARPQRGPAPLWKVRTVTHVLPPVDTALRQQWIVGPIAAGPAGQAAIVLTRGSNVGANAIAIVGNDGVENVTTLMGGAEPVRPRTLLLDATGAMWFNDDSRDTITKYDNTGMHVVVGVEPISVPTPADGRMMRSPHIPTGGYSITLGPDGAAWYARRNELGRVDGTLHFSVPTAYGDVLALRGGTDALWFRTRTTIGRVTTGGAFSTIPFPLPGPFDYGLPSMSMSPGPRGTMWIGTGSHLFELGPTGIEHSARLPDVTIDARSTVTACDGSLYIAESVEQLAVLRMNGTLEEYPTEGLTIDGFARSHDCVIWFVGHDPFGTATVGTIALIPR